MAHLSMTLRAVNHRLTSLPAQQLPAIAASLASSISECGDLLLTPQSQKAGKSDSDHAVQVHKLVTRLSSLLQDRSFEGRWTAVVLVKAVVEAGQWEILRGSESFVRGLMGILSKPDPTMTKTMAIITLTRLFHLTYQYPTLVREITTPSLPAFVTATLNLISVKPSSEPTRKLKASTPLLEVVLRAHAELIARHPTIFRPFTAQIHSILQAIVGSTSGSYPQPVLDIAEQLFVALHHCAPKNTGGEEWKNACRMAITSTHTTLNHVLRAVVEQWESVDPSLRQQLGRPIDYAHEVGSPGLDALGLSSWQGLDTGVKRVVELMRMISTFLKTATSSTVSIPVGSILDLTARLMSMVVPSDAANIQANPQVSRTERENLIAELPQLHVACIRVLRTLVNILETAAIPVAQTILEQTLWVFRAEKFSKKVRTSVYGLIDTLLKHIGSSMGKKNVFSLTDMIRSCCSDLLPADRENSAKDTDVKGKSKTNSGTVNADFFLNPNLKQGRQVNASSKNPKLSRAASDFLQTVLSHLPMEYLAPVLRAEIDRTIIMTSNKNAMYASVLNPFPAVKGRGANVTIIPFLARSYASEMEVEALIRPRMPVLTNSNAIGHYANVEDDDEDEEQEDADTLSAAQLAQETTDFLKPSATPNLQDLVDSTAHKSTTSNKRIYTEETTSRTPVLPQTRDTTPPKKARFESAVPANASASLGNPISGSALLSSTETAPVTQTSLPEEDTSMADATVPRSTIVVEQTSVSQIQTTAPAEEEDSDDEMPTLNIEPDTDDEDDDEE
ncbi:rRNA processing/ribosome biogenesis-domain-containing protein [Aspergillus karnatakaensis]|uniref:RIX1/PELP1 family protein n=1 Tax=Aspergillus karnatakaensis TaxID=1810916 RepID=UPI003CCD7046